MARPPEMTDIRVNGEQLLIRTEPVGTPQGIGNASSTYTALSLAWHRVVRRDRRWSLRVRRFSDDPTGPILHEEYAPDASSAARQLDALVERLRSGDVPWGNS